jgi:soluble lytic murein transglycosylase-like protein
VRRSLWAGVAALALAAALPAAGEAASLQQLEQQQQAAQQQLAATQQAYRTTQSSIAYTLNQMQLTNQELAAARARAQSLDAQVAQTQADLQATAQQLAATRDRLHAEATLLANQVRLMEEHGSIGYLDVVLGAHSFADFVSRLYMLTQVAEMAGHIVAQIRSQEATEQTQAQQLAAQQARLVALRDQAEAAAAQVQADLTQQQVLMASLRAQEASEQATIQALSSRIAALTQQIQALLTQYRGGGLTLHQLYNALYPLVQPIGTQFGLPPALIIAVITEESGGNAQAVSRTGAIGLMQVEPGTAAEMGFPVSDLYNPQENVVIGCTYLHQMLMLFGHTAAVNPALAEPPGNATSYLSAALAAYNAGPGAVEQYGLAGLYALGWGVQGYVANVESLYLEYTGWGTP